MSVLSIGLFVVPWYFNYLVFGAVYCSLSLKSYLWGFIDGHKIHFSERLSLASAQGLQKLWGPLNHPCNAASWYTIHEQATRNNKFLHISLILPVAKTTFPEVPSAEGEAVYLWIILTLRGAPDLDFSLWQQPKFFQITIALGKKSFLIFQLLPFSSFTELCPTLCDPMGCSMPGFLSITNSQSLLKLMSIELVMSSNHLILCHPLLLLPSIFSSIRVFSNESALHIRWP